MSEARCLVLFTKPGRPGRVKTRLIGALTAAQAAALHQAFLDDLLDQLAGGPFALRVAWALAPGEPMPRGEVPGFRQVGRDLGERLYHGLSTAAADCPWVAAVGSDHPELEPARVAEAFRRLEEGADLVLGPSVDGGYYLIALHRRALRATLFAGVPWSTPGVLAATLSRASALGLSVELLAPCHDIDTPRDLEGLTGRLATGAAGCRRTRALLHRWGRLGEEGSS